MIPSRRSFLAGLVAAPAVLKLGLWMPVKVPLIIARKAFVGQISGTVLTVNAVMSGTLNVGDVITGTGIAEGTRITALLRGPRTPLGTYFINIPQTVADTVIT